MFPGFTNHFAGVRGYLHASSEIGPSSARFGIQSQSDTYLGSAHQRVSAEEKPQQFHQGMEGTVFPAEIRIRSKMKIMFFPEERTYHTSY